MLRGALSVSAGSTIARSGSIRSSRRLTFRLLFRNVDHRIFGGLRARASGGGGSPRTAGDWLPADGPFPPPPDSRSPGRRRGPAPQSPYRRQSPRRRPRLTTALIPFSRAQLDALLDIAKPGFATYRQRRDRKLQRLQLLAEKNAARCGLAPCTSRIGPPCCASQGAALSA